MIKRHTLLHLTRDERREVEARQIASRRVTKHRRECDCAWCTSGPRRSVELLVLEPIPVKISR